MALTKGIDKGETNTKLGLDWVIGGEEIEESWKGLWGRDRDVDWGVDEDSGNDVEVEVDYVPDWEVGKKHDWEAEIKEGIGICEVGLELGLVGKDWRV